jgi:adenosylcobinamide kinase/adenosylcobinamide-phosphate guanylyltransferase
MTMTFILGGARSGKSAHGQALAERAAAARGGGLFLIATAQALDGEMADRIRRHQAERGAAWRTIEAPIDIAGAIEGLMADDVAVVDCLTLWLSNLMMNDIDIGAAGSSLIDVLKESPADIILISNEVGLGIVPDNALARRFRDEAGRLHQRIAAIADHVHLAMAGLILTMK